MPVMPWAYRPVALYTVCKEVGEYPSEAKVGLPWPRSWRIEDIVEGLTIVDG